MEAASGAGLVLAPETVAVVIGGIIISIDGAIEAAYGLEMFRQDLGRYQESKEKEGESAPEYKYTWDENINATQEPIEGTNIPKSFTIKGMEVNGKEVWVHGNATKHMGEFVNSANGSVIVENELMTSFLDALSEILPQVQPGRNFFNINGWEIGINGDTGVVYHALYK